MDIFKEIRLLIVGTLLISSLHSQAQGHLSYWSFGPFVGTLNSSTDVATTNSVSAMLKEIRPQIGFQSEYYFNSTIGLGLGVNLGWIYADDANHTNPSRGLQMSSRLAGAESHVIINLKRFGRFRRTVHSAPYIRLGGGVCSVQTRNLGESNVPAETTWYDGVTQNGYFNFAFGMKFKLSLSECIEVELNGSMMPSDRLEGFTYPDMEGAADYFGGIRIRYSFMGIMAPGTF